MSAPEIYSPGLEGVIAGETSISTITGGLRYRGYPVTELAEKTSFEEVAYLLLHGELPTASQLHAFQKRLAEARKIPDSLRGGTEATPDQVRALDVSLILYAEHEFNASTFTARVVCSTESDLHSSIVAAIGALKGRRHGGADEQVMDLLRQAGGPETAEKWIRDALARKERIMGFGHRVYKHGDVRARILKEYARKAAEAVG